MNAHHDPLNWWHHSSNVRSNINNKTKESFIHHHHRTIYLIKTTGCGHRWGAIMQTWQTTINLTQTMMVWLLAWLLAWFGSLSPHKMLYKCVYVYFITIFPISSRALHTFLMISPIDIWDLLCFLSFSLFTVISVCFVMLISDSKTNEWLSKVNPNVVYHIFGWDVKECKFLQLSLLYTFHCNYKHLNKKQKQTFCYTLTIHIIQIAYVDVLTACVVINCSKFCYSGKWHLS